MAIVLALLLLVTTVSCKREKVQEQPKPVLNQEKPAATAPVISPQKYELTQAQRAFLLKMARQTVEAWVKDAKVMNFEIGPDMEILRAQGAAFVTLRKKGALRGCIGHTTAREPLWKCVRDVAISAASEDPRFQPVSRDELKEIDVEVSVLTPLQRVPNADAIVMGRDGVVLKRGWNGGVFLPQVATETGWDKAHFLSELCSQKAGLPADCWQDPQTELYRFEAIVFGEKEPSQKPR